MNNLKELSMTKCKNEKVCTSVFGLFMIISKPYLRSHCWWNAMQPADSANKTIEMTFLCKNSSKIINCVFI